jgi:hypothetical protein
MPKAKTFLGVAATSVLVVAGCTRESTRQEEISHAEEAAYAKVLASYNQGKVYGKVDIEEPVTDSNGNIIDRLIVLNIIPPPVADRSDKRYLCFNYRLESDRTSSVQPKCGNKPLPLPPSASARVSQPSLTPVSPHPLLTAPPAKGPVQPQGPSRRDILNRQSRTYYVWYRGAVYSGLTPGA